MEASTNDGQACVPSFVDAFYLGRHIVLPYGNRSPYIELTLFSQT